MNEFELAAYVDRRLSPADRERVEGHLVDCPDCRRELVEVRGMLRSAARPRRLLLVAGLLAAAAALVIIIRPAQLEPLRGGGVAQGLVSHGPTGEVRSSPVRFAWGGVPGVTTYRLTLAGTDGATIWSASVADTTASLPDSVTLRAGIRYFWVADALLDDGSTRSTGLHEFRLVH